LLIPPGPEVHKLRASDGLLPSFRMFVWDQREKETTSTRKFILILFSKGARHV